MEGQTASRFLHWKTVVGIAIWLAFIALYQLLLPHIVSLGGYVLANTVLGAGLVAASGLVILRARRVNQRTECAENPEPLMQSWEYELPARTGLAIMWIFGVLFWGLGIGLWLLREYSFLIVGPIVGTLLIILGYMGLRHAKSLQSRIGRG